tara:strand:- start:2183 stop:2998 length:816 start_codon:yes stop_codon:yes gene_type:complete
MKTRRYKLDFSGNGQEFSCKEILHETQSMFQKIEISDLDLLGRVLVLDDIIQLSELDCDIYHESFAHIPMSYIEEPDRVLILGGGDGILAKELLKYSNVCIDLVDIDPIVLDLSSKYLKQLNNDSLNNSRVKVFNLDALTFCNNVELETYDAIFGDITDPHPNSPSASLLSDQALETYKSILKKDGVIAIQTDNIQIAPGHISTISSKLKKHFKNENNFSIASITLGGVFSFVCVTDSPIKRKPIGVPTNWLDEEKVKTNFSLHNYIKMGQ